jgi:MFS superfamily sulfate permease-like transporter
VSQFQQPFINFRTTNENNTSIYLTSHKKVNYKTEILAGLTVAMTMIPESLSCNLSWFPPCGLYAAAFIMGLVTAIWG